MNTKLTYIGRAEGIAHPGKIYDVILTGLEVTLARKGRDVVIQYHTVLDFLKEWELPDMSTPISEGVERIAAERKRQIKELGYTAEADDLRYKVKLNELAHAGAAYAMAAQTFGNTARRQIWPWSPESFKPGPRLRSLEKAGALIAAEIDMLLYREMV